MAFIEAGILYLQAPAGNGGILEISRYTTHAAWSPDGTRLLYDVSPEVDPSLVGETPLLGDFRVYEVASGESFSLSARVASFPPPPYQAANWTTQPELIPAAFQTTWIPGGLPWGTSTWTPDGQAIYFINPVEPDLLPVSYPGANTLVVADLAAGHSGLLAEAVLISRVIPGESGHFIVQDHCGDLCEWLTGYDLSGNQTWHLPWVTDGNFAIASNREFIVNTGRIAFDQPTDNNTIDQIDIASGEVSTIWTLDPGQYFIPSNSYAVLLSTDDRLVAFNLFEGDQLFLQVIDRAGISYGKINDAIPVAWQPGGGLVYLQAARDAPPQGVQLMYWRPESNITLRVSDPTQASPLDGSWSPDGGIYAYCSFDPQTRQQNLFTWDPAAGAQVQVFQFNTDQAARCNHVWLPDSSGFYFNAPRVAGDPAAPALWRHNIGAPGPEWVAGGQEIHQP